MSIKRNKPVSSHINELEKAFEERFTEYHFLVDEAVKQGLDIEFARKAVFRCGVFHAKTKFPSDSDLHQIAKTFANDVTSPMFEIEGDVTDDEMIMRFHYCPGVAAWEKLGISEEVMEKYCDIAMEGDRGIFSHYPDLEMKLLKTLARGDDCCKVIVSRKK